VPCFSTSHSPAPHSFRPVLSMSKCSGGNAIELVLPQLACCVLAFFGSHSHMRGL
jgi:hypothetical protein